jgi:hypothetical protein
MSNRMRPKMIMILGFPFVARGILRAAPFPGVLAGAWFRTVLRVYRDESAPV